MIFKCKQHGLVPPARVCSHVHDMLSLKEKKNIHKFNVVKCYLESTVFGEEDTGELIICNNCANSLTFEADTTYKYQLFSEEKKQIFHNIMNFFCCECVDEWIASIVRED
jgi:hypothetical protein